MFTAIDTRLELPYSKGETTMKNKFVIGALLAGACMTSPLAIGQEDHSHLLEGRVFSASANIVAGTASVVIYEIPAKRTLIVTQFCKGFMGPELSGSKLGRVPSESISNCTTYVPGVRFKGGQAVVCESFFINEIDVPCLINGVIQ